MPSTTRSDNVVVMDLKADSQQPLVDIVTRDPFQFTNGELCM